MTKELEKKYEKLNDAIMGIEDKSLRDKLFKEIMEEETEQFNRVFGGGNIVRLHVICAMCDMMADSVRATLKRRCPGADIEAGIDTLKAAMGVISNG